MTRTYAIPGMQRAMLWLQLIGPVFALAVLHAIGFLDLATSIPVFTVWLVLMVAIWVYQGVGAARTTRQVVVDDLGLAVTPLLGPSRQVPWGEITELQSFTQPTRRGLVPVLNLITADGASVRVTALLSDYEELERAIKRRCTRAVESNVTFRQRWL